jgi:hypothetical protein
MRGRPSKISRPEFTLLALAAFARRGSQEQLAARIASDLGESVSQPSVRAWLLGSLPRLARPTVALKRPDRVGVRIGCLLFRVPPGRARALSRRLSREPLVSRVDRWRGEVNVFAEVVALDPEELEDLIERYEPDAVYDVIERNERCRVPLRELGRRLARATSTSAG